MNPREAKLILRAHRADGRYAANDPLFAEALAVARRDANLNVWLEHEHAFDATVASRLEAVPPPAGLRDAILVGAKASRLQRRWWRQPGWIAAAACLAVALGVSALLRPASAPDPVVTAFGNLTCRELATYAHQHVMNEQVMLIEAELENRTRPLTDGLVLDLNRLRSAGCSQMQIAGREVFEVCFRRGTTWYHLYVARRDPADGAPRRTPVQFLDHSALHVATWSDGTLLYSLVTRSGPDALKRVV